jgi:hypothetical protein
LKSILTILITTLLIINCSGSYNHDCENEIISHEIWINEKGQVELKWNFQVCEANLKEFCGYYYYDYWYGTEHELVCEDLYPSSVGYTGVWNPETTLKVWGDIWTDVWLVYGDGKTSPVYTVLIEADMVK